LKKFEQTNNDLSDIRVTGAFKRVN